MKLRIKYQCPRCNGIHNENATDACPTCFGKGSVEETINNVEEYNEVDDD